MTDRPSQTTRRDFLKLVGVSSFSAIAAAYLPSSLRSLPSAPDSGFKADFIGPIPIYGLKTPLANREDLVKLYDETDQSFLERREQLNPNERYLQVQVRESTYSSDASFVDRIQQHIDTLNRMIENAKPTSAIRAKLKRVIIVANDLNISDQRKPLDIDASWLIGNNPESDGYSWSFHADVKGNTVFSMPTSPTPRIYTFPRKIDSLFGKNGHINFLDIHEMTHFLLNLPDEYFFDVQLDSALFRFSNFRLGTGYNTEPRMSPYSSIRLEFLRKMARDKIGNGGVYAQVFGEIPRDINLAIYDVDGNKIEGARAFVLEPAPSALKTENDYFWRQRIAKRPVGPYALRWDSWQHNSHHSLTQPKILQYQGQAYPWYPTNAVINSRAGSVHLPFAAFNMSQWSGVKSASYEIHFKEGSRGLNFGMGTQVLEMIDETDLEDSPYHYATMKVAGTSTYFVWSLRANI